MKRFLAFTAAFLLCISLIPASAQDSDAFSVEHEAILSALYEADIATLREAIDLKLISCEELTAYYLERIEAYNSSRNCFITMCDDALEVARQRDEALANGTASGILFGIPVVIKDNIDLAGYHTTNGHKKKDSQIADSNATVVDYLLSQGAVIIAKTNMSTDAQSARDSISIVAGQTKNAYSKYLSSAGSSGGSAVATSLNFAAAALGTDTNSSLRFPAAYAGCVSLRGTHGLISCEGVTKTNRVRDIPGAITRTVYDQAIMLDVLTNGQYNYTENLNGNALAGLRIGVLKELSYAVSSQPDRKEANIDPEISAAFAAALEELEACGAELVEVSFPKIFSLSQATFVTNGAPHRAALYSAFTEKLEQYDVCAVVFPTYLSTPLRSGTDAEGTYWNVWDQTYINNCSILSPSASLPEISIPIGLHSLGCGIGMEIATYKNQEQLLLDIAYSYTSRYDHRVLPTHAPDTYADSNAGTLQEIIDAYKVFLNPPQPTEPPTVPTTEPTLPTTVPAVPTTHPTEPTTVPTVPITQPTTVPTEPTTQPTQPTTVPTAPTTQPTQPTTVTTEPTTQPTQLPAQSTTSTAGNSATNLTASPTPASPAPSAPWLILCAITAVALCGALLLLLRKKHRNS